MATVIDISILNSVTIIIVFMLVFVGGWGILTMINPFKGSTDKGKSFYGLLAFLVAVLVVMNRATVGVILTATPWLILLALVAFFFIFFAKMFGTSDSAITVEFGKRFGWVIFFVSLIVIFAIGASFGQDLLSAQVPGQPPVTTLPEGSVTNADGSIILPDGSIIVPDSTGAVTPSAGVASSDFGSNLILTLFHPKILGVLFLFLLGTLTILLLNQGTG